MTTMICTVCSEPKVVTSRSVVLPFVCDECQKAEELYNAMAPTPAPLKVEESDNHACDSATVENTTLLIEDQANQLALAKNEVEALRQIVQYLEAREIALTAQVENRQNQVENLLVKNFFKDEKISGLAKQNERLGVAGFQQAVRTLGLWAKGASLARRYDALKAEFQYAAKRLFELAAEVGKLTHERDVWQKRAEIAKRCYDRASADRRYYRGKLKDAGIKA